MIKKKLKFLCKTSQETYGMEPWTNKESANWAIFSVEIYERVFYIIHSYITHIIKQDDINLYHIDR